MLNGKGEWICVLERERQREGEWERERVTVWAFV